jgi:tetratricopeptide (TPR) repeat protein
VNPTPNSERTVAASADVDPDKRTPPPTDADPETEPGISPTTPKPVGPVANLSGPEGKPIQDTPTDPAGTIVQQSEIEAIDPLIKAICPPAENAPDLAIAEHPALPDRAVSPAGTVDIRPGLSTGNPSATPLTHATIEPIIPNPAGSTVRGEARLANGQSRPDVPGYRLLEIIGRGGMGVVYRATDLELNRTVALKMVMTSDHAADGVRVRFQEETKSVARLQHANIVQIFEVGEVDGIPFCALEFVPGGTLAASLAGIPQDPVLAAQRAEVLARAMDAVHSAGIIHRDLKPANVLLAADGTLKITDFGLAKRLDGVSGLTLHGEILGTPSYMAPEQALGELERVGPLSDVWALGAILYEMLTGRPPFRGTRVQETLIQVYTDDPVSIRLLQPGCPRDLETVCLKCLEKEPAKRYSSAAALAEDLTRFLDNRSILARRAGPVERTVKWARRSPLRAMLAATVAICLGMLVTILLLKFQADHKDAIVARQEAALKDHELDEARRHESARARFNSLYAEAEQAATVARPDAVTWESVVRSLQSANEVARSEPNAFTEWSLKASADRLLARANAALADARLRENERAKLTRLGELHGDAVFFATLATGLGLEDNLERVRQAVAEGLALFQIDINGDGPPRVALGFFTPDELRTVTSRCYELLLLDAQALTMPRPADKQTAGAIRQPVPEALRRLDRADRLLSGTQTRSGLTQRAEYLAALGKKDESESIVTKAEATAPILAGDYFLIGMGFHRRDEFGKAIPALAAALRIEPTHYGAQYLLAACQLQQRRFQEAKIGLTRCLVQRPKFIWPRLLRALAEMDLARQGLGAYQDARDDLDAVLTNPPDDAARYVALTNRGVLAIYLRDWDAAESHLKEAINRRPDALPAYVNLALTHRYRAEDPRMFALALAPGGTFVFPVAFAEYRRHALDGSIAVLDEAIRRHPNESRLYHERGRTHLLRADSTPARADLARAVLFTETPGGISTLVDDLLDLGQLMHASGEYSYAAQTYAAVLEIPAAKIAGEKRALAARRLAEPLIALKKWKEAATAIDLYLELTPVAEGQSLPDGHSRRMADALKVRALIHAEQNDLRAALESYTRALGFVRDPEVLILRGWAYHAMGATGLGLKDFEEVLSLRPGDSNALLGRADARVKSNQLREALADANEALRNLPADIRSQTRFRLLYNASRVFAQLAQREPDPAVGGRHLSRTADLLRQILSDSPLADRPRLWKDLVVADPVLGKMSLTPALAGVAAEFGNRGQ